MKGALKIPLFDRAPIFGTAHGDARVLAILLNTAMFFFGQQAWPVQTGLLGTVIINPYDLSIWVIVGLLLYFFATTAWTESVRLAKEGK